ncbi:MAG TPA: YihY/virulence factor BrkB family protein [Longimicrobiaceae bacterium]
MALKDTFELVKEAGKDFMDDECPRLAAALSYYTVFALPPLLILILMIVGAFVSREQVQEAMQTQMGSMIGQSGAEGVHTILTHAKQPGESRGIGAVLGVLAAVFGATGAFGQLQAALNRAWEVEPDPKAGGLKNFVFKRLLSFGMILGVAFLLLVSLALTAAISAMGGALGRVLPGLGEPVLHVINFTVTFVVITGLFATMFKVLPDAKIAWKDVWVGAVVTAVLFMVGKFAIGLYLGRSNPGQAFGAAASLAVILVWIYYASMILLFGAEFTQTWAVRRGSGIEPEEGAVRVVEEKRHVRDPREEAELKRKEEGKK